MSEPKYCFRCGDLITSKYGKKFCSNKCAALHANEFAAKATRKDKSHPCDECGKVFEKQDTQSKFCSRSCSAKFHNRKRSQRVRHRCLGCENTILGRQSYCSSACRTAHNIRLWIEGQFNATKTYTISKFIRDYVIEKAGYKCTKCGYSQRRGDGSHNLQVHHVDGDWENSRPENLECLCPNCHALTDNYGAQNMGKGRKWKKKYSLFAGLAER